MQTPKDGNASKKYGSLIIRVLVACAALSLVFWNLKWDELAIVFRKLDMAIFVFGLGVFTLSQILLSVRWWLLLVALDIALPIKTAAQLHFIGLFYNNVMPSSVGGDFLRAWYVSKHTHRRVEAALSVFIDRGIGLFSIFLMALFSYLFLIPDMPFSTETTETDPANNSPVMALYYLVLSLSAIGTLAMLYKPSRCFIIGQLLRFWAIFQVMLGKLKTALLVYWHKPLVLTWTLGLTFVLQSCTILVFWVIGQNIGMQASLRYYFIIFPVMWVVAVLPISVAGIGVLEGGIVFLFVHLTQTTQEQATCLALCQRFIWLLTSIPGAGIHFWGLHRPKSFSFDDETKDD